MMEERLSSGRWAFGDLPEAMIRREGSAIAIVPAPYDGTSTWQKGANRGPAALLEASVSIEYFDLETRTEVCLRGIFTDAPVTESSNPEAAIAAVRTAVDGHLREGRFVATIGGEHSVSIGAIQAHARHFPGLTILQFDAHADLRDAYEGSAYNHACVMARAREIAPIVQVGIRSADTSEREALAGHPVFYAADIVVAPDDGWMDAALEALGPRVYVTFDLDAFDPSIMPATGTPEPGGLLWYPTLRFLRRVARERELVGFDIVELCPHPAHKAADVLAAKLLYKMLTYRFSGVRAGCPP